MTKLLNDNVVYYTIVSKDDLKLKIIDAENERLETLQSKHILKYLLKQFGIKGSIICRTELGKPYFKDNDVFFSYSHSNNYIACAISKRNVGIDIEETDRIINDTMIKICNFNEETKLEEFVTREAFCKLIGAGIARFFDKNIIKNIDKKYLIIKEKNYICSIFSDYNSPSFNFIDIK